MNSSHTYSINGVMLFNSYYIPFNEDKGTIIISNDQIISSIINRLLLFCGNHHGITT